MKSSITNFLLILAILLMVWKFFFSSEEYIEPKPVTITIPEYSGTKVDTLERFVRDTIYLPSNTIVVDSGWKKKYNEALDSLERQRLYYEAIKINKYEKTLIDNDSIEIKGYATTRGALLDYSVDYKIKSFDFSYTPDVVVKRPRLSLGLGLEAGLPSTLNTNFLLKGNLYFENSKGNRFNFGYDTEKRFWVGYSKTFKIRN